MLNNGDQPGNELENALRMALCTLEEKAALARPMAEEALRADMTSFARTRDSRAPEATRQSDAVRHVLAAERTGRIVPRRTAPAEFTKGKPKAR